MSSSERYPNVTRLLRETPWAMLPAALDGMLEIARYRLAGGELTDDMRAAIDAARREPPAPTADGVAVLNLFGVLSQRANMMTEMSGGTSAEQFVGRFRQAMADPQVGSIVLNVDSPGGSVFGIAEAAEEIRASRGRKPIVAVANSMAASAAYWIASAADELVASPSAQVGSIGVFAVHEDMSAAYQAFGVRHTLVSAGKYKTEGNPYEPLAEEARGALQAEIDHYYDLFVRAVARQRGVGVDAVRSGYGEGRAVNAQTALALGMVDRVETLDQTIARLQRARRQARTSATAATVTSVEIALTADPAIIEPGTVDDPAAYADALAAGRIAEISDEPAAAARRRRRWALQRELAAPAH